MTGRAIIGLDAGTSVIKAVAFALDGGQIASAATRNVVNRVSGGGAEQDIAWTWEAAARTLKTLGEDLAGRGLAVEAIAVTGQGDGTWLIDAAGEPVAPAWLWLDGRAGAIVEAIRGSPAGRRLYEITGTGLNPAIQTGQLLWMKAHTPEVVRRAATAFHCKDWIYFKLSGERATDPAEGVFTFGNFRTRAYDDEVLDILGLEDVGHLRPPLVDGSRHLGRLTDEAAVATGLPSGTPVVLAPVDVLCTAIGAGIYERERPVGVTILGSTGIHMRLYQGEDAVQLNDDQTGYVMPMPVPGTWAAFQSNMAATLNIDWLVDLYAELAAAACGGDAPDRKALLTLLDRKAGEAAPGRALFHPYISENGERGPFVEPRARAQFTGLATGVGPFDLMRGVYEGLGFAARDCYRALGHRPDEVRIAGGAARSPVIRDVMAATMGRPLRLVNRDEAGAAGAAIVASLALGLHATMDDAVARWVHPYLGGLHAADPDLSARYDRLFDTWREGYQAMFGFWASRDKTIKEIET